MKKMLSCLYRGKCVFRLRYRRYSTLIWRSNLCVTMWCSRLVITRISRLTFFWKAFATFLNKSCFRALFWFRRNWCNYHVWIWNRRLSRSQLTCCCRVRGRGYLCKTQCPDWLCFLVGNPLCLGSFPLKWTLSF